MSPATTSQPAYWKLPSKVSARKENAETYRRLTGRHSLPADRGYWTLCSYQPPEDGAEIVQLEAIGLLRKDQFFGVDRDEVVIKKNRVWHPEAHWHCGEWAKVIRQQDFRPALVYLDLVQFADGKGAADAVASTMYLCPPGTVLLANAMLNDPRSRTRFDPSRLIRRVERSVGTLELKKWNSRVDNFEYSGTRKTNMITYVFHKS